jgi:uncharacterized protein YjdB
MRARVALWFSLFFLVLLPACASFNELTGPTLVPGVVASVEVPTTQTSLSVGSTLALQARIRDGGGNTVVDKSVMWTSSDTSVARVSPEGVVTGVREGTARIAASVQGRSAITMLNITSRPVASVLVNPPSPNILVGAQLQLSSTTLGEAGDVLAGRSVFWQTSNPLVASIDNTGLLTGLGVGVTTITATSESRSASVGVTVVPVPVASVQVTPAVDTVVVGQTTQLTASPRDSIGTPLPDRALGWTSSNGAVATVSAAGLVVGAQAGTVTMTATSEGKSGTARIVVLARPVSSVIVSPSQAAIIPGQSLKLSVVITDDNGTLLTGRPVQYRSGNTSIAQVSSDGTITGVNEGTTRITVTSENRTGGADVVVSASPIASVRINAPVAEMAIGATQKLVATPLDAGNNALPARPVTWRSGATSIATVAEDGSVTAVAAGTVVIFATVEGKLASITLTVRAITVTTVGVAPPAATVFVGDFTDLGAQPRDANGNVIVGRNVQWTSSDERIAVVSSNGRVRALAPGSALISASIDGVQGSSAITTSIEPVLTITAEPSTLNMLPTQTTNIVGTPRGRNGVALNRAVTFSSSDQSIASVSQTGVVTAVRTGRATITVSSEGRQVLVPVEVGLAPVETITITIPQPTRFVTQTTQATVETKDRQGNVLTGRPVQWSSSEPSIATVSSTGLITARAPGTTRITVTAEGKSASANVTVSLVPVVTVSVLLNNPDRHVEETTQATATPRDSAGGALAGRTVVWSSSNPGIATVSQAGLVTAVFPGTADIIATVDGRTGRAPVNVTPIPVANVAVSLADPKPYVLEKTQATATLTDASGRTLTGRTIAWSSSNPSVATVSTTGLVSAIAPGTAVITAMSEQKSGSATVEITIAPVAQVVASLQHVERYVGQTTQASAVLRDRSNNLLTGRVVTWSSADPQIATVSTTGVVTAVSPGTTTITATSETIRGTVSFKVSLVPVATVTVAAPQTALQVNQNVQATVTLRDSAGGELKDRPVQWSSSNNAVATVSATGLIHAVSVGDAVITATSETRTGTIAINVSLIPVASVAVTLERTTVFIGYTTKATATMRDAANNELVGRAVTWQSSNPAAATISADGVITAIANGTSTITATSEGISNTAIVNVTQAPVAFVNVTADNLALIVGQKTQAHALLSDENRRPLTGRVVEFSTSNASVATVDNAGVVTATGAGSVNIIAASEGKTGFITIVVDLVPVASVTASIDGGNAILPVGGTVQALAVARDADGNILVGRTVQWTATDPEIALVAQNGVVRGISPGTTTITASIGGRNGTVSVTVVRTPVASIVVTLDETSIRMLQSTTARATLRDANDVVLTGRQITWSSSNLLVALVSANGEVRGLLPGTAQITATSEGIAGSATINVTVIPVSTVTVSLANPSLVAGGTTQATAVMRDASGTVLENRDIAWSSSNSAVATVSASGVVTSIAAGTADIIGTSEGRTGSAPLTVTAPIPGPVETVEVTLRDPTIANDGSTQASVVLKDAAGTVATGRDVDWSTSNNRVATVNRNGVVRGRRAGTAVITATSEGKTGSATISVTGSAPVPVETVTVKLASSTVAVGDSTTATAELKDEDGDVLTGRTVVWSSSDPAVATVSADGVVKAIAPGTATITATSENKTGTAVITVP